MSDPLFDTLKHRFGFDGFRPGQEAVVRDVLAGRDVLAVMPTGGGKSLCFQLPAVMRSGVTLVVSPLIALMQDQVRQLTESGVPASFLNSTLSAAESGERIARALRGETRLVYVAPERLLLPQFMDGFLRQLSETQGIAAFTIDEAHCVSEWGHDFRPEYRQLASLRERFAGVPVLAFTATATPRVRQDIATQLALRDPVVHVASFNRPNLHYAVQPKSQKSYAELLALAREDGGCGIVYCMSRKRVDELAARLSADGVRALPYHAGMMAEERRDNQERFIRDDVQVIVATIAFGMGINKPDVRWVVHFDLPRTMESYYQEAGRAGRDSEPARCILYFGAGDIRTAEFLIDQKVHPETGEPLEEEQRIARQQLRQVIDYAESVECRRAIQLRYFGEVHPGRCGACDNCLQPRELEDRTLQARQFLSCVARLAQRRQRFGTAHVIDILRGAQNEKVLKNGHDELSVYGIGAQESQDSWRALARSLLHQGLVEETSDGYPVLTLNAASWMVLRGERGVQVAASRRAPKREKAPRRLAPEGVGDATLFDRLRQLRKRLADAQGVPPYVVFSDASLRAMCEAQPCTLHEFAGVHGVGDRKLAQYGEAFTAAIREHREQAA